MEPTTHHAEPTDIGAASPGSEHIHWPDDHEEAPAAQEPAARRRVTASAAEALRRWTPHAGMAHVLAAVLYLVGLLVLAAIVIDVRDADDEVLAQPAPFVFAQPADKRDEPPPPSPEDVVSRDGTLLLGGLSSEQVRQVMDERVERFRAQDPPASRTAPPIEEALVVEHSGGQECLAPDTTTFFALRNRTPHAYVVEGVTIEDLPSSTWIGGRAVDQGVDVASTPVVVLPGERLRGYASVLSSCRVDDVPYAVGEPLAVGD